MTTSQRRSLKLRIARQKDAIATIAKEWVQSDGTDAHGPDLDHLERLIPETRELIWLEDELAELDGRK